MTREQLIDEMLAEFGDDLRGEITRVVEALDVESLPEHFARKSAAELLSQLVES